MYITCIYKICFAVVEIDLFNKEKTSTKYRERLKSCVTSINRLGLSCDFLLTWNPNGNTNVAAELNCNLKKESNYLKAPSMFVKRNIEQKCL